MLLVAIVLHLLVIHACTQWKVLYQHISIHGNNCLQTWTIIHYFQILALPPVLVCWFLSHRRQGVVMVAKSCQKIVPLDYPQPRTAMVPFYLFLLTVWESLSENWELGAENRMGYTVRTDGVVSVRPFGGP